MEILVRAHSGLRYVVLGLLVVAILTAMAKRAETNPTYSKIYLWTMIATHVQLLLGLILYFMNWGVKVRFDMMSEKIYRFFSVEHSIGMLIAIVMITMANSQGKKGNHNRVFLYYILALIIILVSIPWPFRDLGGRWF